MARKPILNTRLKKGVAATAAAIALIGAWEGLRLRPYKDIVGVPTVCFGETRNVKMSDGPYTKKQCEEMLGSAIKEFEYGMRKCLTSPDTVPQGLYVASLSLAYNVGIGGFCRSSVRRYTNAKQYRKACDSLKLWNRAGGKIVQGLVNRRKHERKICLSDLEETTSRPAVEAPAVEEPEPVAKPKPKPKPPAKKCRWWQFWC